ncbi:MAG: DUF86 domain-containing protein [Pseudomonadota bacterium]
MPPEARKYLWDVDAARRITRFTYGKSLKEYESDELLRSAVERQFEIIGEALSKFRAVDPESAKAIPELPRIVAFRNILIHGYASVDDKLVWGIVEGKLESLARALEHELES